MISVHSSGQPSTKMIAWDRIMNCTGVRFIASTHCSTSDCPPSSANTAEKSADPTNSQHTIAVVLAVRNTDSLTRWKFSVPAWTASRKAPAAPTAADSVAVVSPKRITASTSSVSSPSGITDSISIFRITNCSACIFQ